MEKLLRGKTKRVAALFVLLLSVGLIETSSGTEQSSTAQAQAQSEVVYVCACLKTKSCSCVTEAKTEGPCSCGTEGGPPMKAVPKNSAWAKANRKALAE